MAGSCSTEVPISKLPSENESLLINIVKEDHPQSRWEPPIQKVPPTLRHVKTNKTCFDPKMVTLGPYHYEKSCPKPMDCYKKDAVRWFVSLLPNSNSDDEVKKIYRAFVEVSSGWRLRDLYAADETVEHLEDEDFAYMMFLDGCFILYLVDLAVKRPNDLLKYPRLHHPFIVSDIFLLENQIPYGVLKSLMSLMPDPKPLTKKHIEKFIEEFFLPKHSSTRTFDRIRMSMSILLHKSRDPDPSISNDEPLHLLDFLRTKLIGGSVDTNENCADYYFRSIMELKATGIELYKSHSRALGKIEFNEGLIYGHLSLPQLIIDDATKDRLLNLIAYEMCGCLSDPACTITSYICFLDTLIDHADDVKELRSKDILLNRLGSDEEVAKLFNEVAINLVPDPRVYAKILIAIQLHCRNQLKVLFAEFLHTHFRSPWTVISLGAAILLLFLTIVQTVKAVW